MVFSSLNTGITIDNSRNSSFISNIQFGNEAAKILALPDFVFYSDLEWK